MRQTLAASVFALLLAAAAKAQSQGQDTVSVSSRLTAITVGVPGVGRETFYPLATVGMTFNGFRANQVNPEFAAGTMPYTLGLGVPVIGMRLGLSVPSVLSGRVILLPSGGVGTILLLGADASGATAGAYAGIAAVLGSGQTPAFRVGMTWHQLYGFNESVWLLEVGVVRPFRRDLAATGLTPRRGDTPRRCCRLRARS